MSRGSAWAASFVPVDLKKVLFSGEPWLIQCYSGLPWEGQHLPRPFRIAQAFKARAAQGHGIPVHPTLLCDACRR